MPQLSIPIAAITDTSDPINPTLLAISIAVAVLQIAALWPIFVKAGDPGWASVVPIYNLVVLFRIAEMPVWCLLLMFVPIVNLVIAILVVLRLAWTFGKGLGFSLGLVFLPFVFYPLLGFGAAEYRGIAS
jgi:hypothetical protein